MKVIRRIQRTKEFAVTAGEVSNGITIEQLKNQRQAKESADTLIKQKFLAKEERNKDLMEKKKLKVNEDLENMRLRLKVKKIEADMDRAKTPQKLIKQPTKPNTVVSMTKD